MIGTSYGAISVLNAIPCGIGATIGISLQTRVQFIPGTDETQINILNGQGIDDRLVRICVERTLKEIAEDPDVNYELTVRSHIPPSRGLKSSSSVCNATISAVLNHYRVRMEPMDMLRIGVECAKEAGVTVTGAFDDTCGCHFGGLVITDNTKNELLYRDDIPDYDVILWIPENTIPKNKVPVDAYRSRRAEFEEVLALVKEKPLEALTENGRLVSEIIGSDTTIVDLALSNGALAAGISGTGPAISIVTECGKGRRMADIIGGNTILAVTK